MKDCERYSRIAGMGACLPEEIFTNEQVAEHFQISPESIQKRSGIQSRHWAPAGTSGPDLAVPAAIEALEEAGWDLSDIEYIIYATLSSSYLFPGDGCYFQKQLGALQCGVLDIRNQCSGFLFALEVADGLITSGKYRKILLVCAEVQSHCFRAPNGPENVGILFGDGAAVLALESSPYPGILRTKTGSDGSGADALRLSGVNFQNIPITELNEGESTFPEMDGQKVFLRAIATMQKSCEEILIEENVSLTDIDLIVPHQANGRMIETLTRRLKVSEEKVYSNIAQRGNTTAASIPLALYDAREANKLAPNSLILMTGFGSGFTWGSALMRYT